MPQLRPADQALRRLTRQQTYICTTCRAAFLTSTRSFSTTPTLSADLPFYRRIQQTLFPSTASREAKESASKQLAERAREDASKTARETKMVKKRGGREEEYEVAAVVDSSVSEGYVAATHWDGLRRVGGKEWVREKRDGGEVYVGFVPEKKLVLSDEQWEMLIHHVTVEVLALSKAGRDINDISLPRSESLEDFRRTQTTTIELDDAGRTASLQYSSPEAGDQILSAIPQVPAVTEVAKTEEASAEESEEIEQLETELEDLGVADQDLNPTNNTALREILEATTETQLTQYPTSASWLNLRLQDPTLKLAITKRILQLTATRIPDPVLSTSQTLSSLLTALKTKPAPKKLAQSPKLVEVGAKLANVEVHSKRQTIINKERRVGRWKIIEDELIARDLPVTGSRWRGGKPRLGLEKS